MSRAINANCNRQLKIWLLADGLPLDYEEVVCRPAVTGEAADTSAIISIVRKSIPSRKGRRGVVIVFMLPEHLGGLSLESDSNSPDWLHWEGWKVLYPDIEVEKILYHNWVSSPHSNGSWMAPRVGEFLNLVDASQIGRDVLKTHGRIVWAGSDLETDGFLGYVEGAVSSGHRAASNINYLLH
jgi:hypothetical protein